MAGTTGLRSGGRKTMTEMINCVAWKVAQACQLCAEGVPHHTVGQGGIGDSARYVAYDLHEVSDAGGVGLAECTAYELWVGVLQDVREAYRAAVGGTAI